MLRLNGTDELLAAVGSDLGHSAWVDVTQELIDDFADATGDHQWLHTDPERAAKTPLGGTIAHGLLTFSLGPPAMFELIEVEGFSLGFNYGYDRVRFTAPVPVDSRVRMHASLAAAERVDDGVFYTLAERFELEGSAKPVCVANQRIRLYD